MVQEHGTTDHVQIKHIYRKRVKVDGPAARSGRCGPPLRCNPPFSRHPSIQGRRGLPAARAACVCSVTVYTPTGSTYLHNNDVVEKLIYDDAKHLTPAGGCRASQCCTNYITQTLLSPRRRHRVRNQADHVKPSLADVSPCRIGSNRYPDRWLRKGMLEAVQQVKTTI